MELHIGIADVAIISFWVGFICHSIDNVAKAINNKKIESSRPTRSDQAVYPRQGR